MNNFESFWISALSGNGRGVALALVSNCMFVLTGVCVRYLSETIDVFQILLFRQLVFIAVLSPAIVKNFHQLMRPSMVKLHILRVFAAFVALLLGFLTVSNIGLAEATALGFTKVLFVALLSFCILKEPVSLSRLAGLVVGFSGVLLVVQPSFDSRIAIYSMTGIGSAMAAAVAVFCVRKIAQTGATVHLLVYQALFVGLLALIPSLWTWSRPTLAELALLVLVGAISSVAQWFGVTAYKYGEANVVSNVEYTQMIYSLVLGYCIFGESPGWFMYLGAAMIIFSMFLPNISFPLIRHRYNSLLRFGVKGECSKN